MCYSKYAVIQSGVQTAKQFKKKADSYYRIRSVFDAEVVKNPTAGCAPSRQTGCI